MSNNTPPFGQQQAKESYSGSALTPQILSTIVAGNAHDPVARQYIPSIEEENITSDNETSDPINDYGFTPVTGIVHRHKDRVLLKITDTCDAYCRFCFRKDMVGQGKGFLNPEELDAAINYIAKNPDIFEVIFTGGDPLTLSNRRLQKILDRLHTIDHLKIIRFHTRSPLMNPSRIDEEFIALIQSCKKSIYIVLHVNHPQEINTPISDCFIKLQKTGAVLLSQSVLLRGVNDSISVLESLFRTLIVHKIKPYYLHHPDLAIGTKHFRVSIDTGLSLMQDLRQEVSGICLPTYVLDIPGGHGKIPLESHLVDSHGNGTYTIRDGKGNTHAYKDNL